nr:hypothetical protein [uncultured Arsenicibacter sp.]
MHSDNLKAGWTEHKRQAGSDHIPEAEILAVIRQEAAQQHRIRRLLYHSSCFMFLLFFCQTC